MAKTKATKKQDKQAVETEAKTATDTKQSEAQDTKKKKGKPSKVSSGSISMYLAEIGRFNPLPPEREVELAIRIQNNDERAVSYTHLTLPTKA